MYGKVIAKIKELDETVSSIEVDVDINNGSPEEVCNLCHSVADATNATKFPEVAGMLALSILTNQPCSQLLEELGAHDMLILSKELHEETNELVQEIIARNKRKKHKESLRERLDKLFSK